MADPALLLHCDSAGYYTDACGHTPALSDSPVGTTAEHLFGDGAAAPGNGGWAAYSGADLEAPAGGVYTLEIAYRLPPSAPSSDQFCWLVGNAVMGIGIYRPTGTTQIHYLIRRNGTTDLFGPLINSGQWTRLATVRTGSGAVKLFIDGILSLTSSGSAGNATGQTVFVGRKSSSDHIFPGYYDEVRWSPGVELYTTDYTPAAGPFSDPAVVGQATVPIDVTVGPAGVATLPLGVTVAPVGQAAVPVALAVLPPALLVGSSSVCWPNGASAAVWGAVVSIDGVDVSSVVVGAITVEAEEGTARLAEFALRPAPGTVIDLAGWCGAAVAIDVTDMSTGTHRYGQRLFTGVVDTPAVDLKTRLLTLRCTDDLQGQCDAAPAAVLDALIGGRWSPVVFNPASAGWRYAQDRLATVAASLDADPFGALRVTAWAPKTTPDLSFSDGQVLDGTLAVQLADRAGIVNAVDVEFGFRYPRLKAEGHGVAYSYVSMTNFAAFVLAGGWFLQRAAVERAISAAGGHLVTPVTYDPLPTGIVALGTGGFWTPGPFDDTLCMGFTATVSFDYSQTVDEQHRIAVENAASIAAVGRQAESMSGALEGIFQEPESWEGKMAGIRAGTDPIPVADAATVVGGMTTAKNPTLAPGADRATADEAMRCLIDIAKQRIQASLRRNAVMSTTLLNPAIDVDKTLRLVADGVVAQGKCRRVVHRLDVEAGSAVSEFAIALCRVGGVGYPHPETTTTAPPEDPATSAPITTPVLVVYNGGATQDHEITITFPAVAAGQRDNAEPLIATKFAAAVFEDDFSLIA